MGNQITPLVSVCVITYNHEEFIEQTIKSFLNQVTDFPFEVVVGEDWSPDRTREICAKYQRKYPDVLRLLPSVGNKGAARNFVDTFNACRGKYVAICDGDDYWTDPHKLKKQVDVLEDNPQYMICSHDVKIEWTDVKKAGGFQAAPDKYDFLLVLEKHFIPTPSILVRKKALPEFPGWYFKQQSGDKALALMATSRGKGIHLNQNMAFKRKHNGGISQHAHHKDYEQFLKSKLVLYDGINRYTKFKYNNHLCSKVASNNLYLFLFYLKTGRFKKTGVPLSQFFKSRPYLLIFKLDRLWPVFNDLRKAWF